MNEEKRHCWLQWRASSIDIFQKSLSWSKVIRFQFLERFISIDRCQWKSQITFPMNSSHSFSKMEWFDSSRTSIILRMCWCGKNEMKNKRQFGRFVRHGNEFTKRLKEILTTDEITSFDELFNERIPLDFSSLEKKTNRWGDIEENRRNEIIQDKPVLHWRSEWNSKWFVENFNTTVSEIIRWTKFEQQTKLISQSDFIHRSRENDEEFAQIWLSSPLFQTFHQEKE